MTKAVRYIIFPLIIWAYIFGSSGFIVHNCYMSDSCFVSNSIISAWDNFMFSDCSNTLPVQSSDDDENTTDNILVWAQSKGKCSESVHVLDSCQYQNQSNTDIQHLTATADFRYQDDLLNQVAEKNTRLYNNADQSLHGVRHSLDKLCIFLL